MKITVALIVTMALLSGPLVAQEPKKVPKDSIRVTVTGCTKGYVFTAGPRTEDQVGRLDIPEGMHLRMNGPKKTIADIRAHEGSMIAITGLMKKGQPGATGIAIGGGVRIQPGPAQAGGNRPAYENSSPNYIDVEAWQPSVGDCPSR